MLRVTLRDLQWRKRRFAIAIVGTGLVFACTLILTGLANGFDVEATRTVDSLGFDHYLIKEGAPGPFLGSAPFSDTEITEARHPSCDTGDTWTISLGGHRRPHKPQPEALL